MIWPGLSLPLSILHCPSIRAACPRCQSGRRQIRKNSYPLEDTRQSLSHVAASYFSVRPFYLDQLQYAARLPYVPWQTIPDTSPALPAGQCRLPGWMEFHGKYLYAVQSLPIRPYFNPPQNVPLWGFRPLAWHRHLQVQGWLIVPSLRCSH